MAFLFGQQARPRQKAQATSAAAPAPPAPERLSGHFRALNAAFFHGACSAAIGWGRAGTPRRRQRRSMVLGSYCQREHRIRIHPALADPFVPDFVLELVVFHEMLHEFFGTDGRGAGGRRRLHPPEFRAIEQSHPRYAEAAAWEARSLPQLLRLRA